MARHRRAHHRIGKRAERPQAASTRPQSRHIIALELSRRRATAIWSFSEAQGGQDGGEEVACRSKWAGRCCVKGGKLSIWLARTAHRACVLQVGRQLAVASADAGSAKHRCCRRRQHLLPQSSSIMYRPVQGGQPLRGLRVFTNTIVLPQTGQHMSGVGAVEPDACWSVRSATGATASNWRICASVARLLGLKKP